MADADTAMLVDKPWPELTREEDGMEERGVQTDSDDFNGDVDDLFEVAEYDLSGQWTYDIYLNDWFAAAGEDHVGELIRQLQAEARIVEVHHEDREHLLVNAPDLTLDNLHHLVRKWFYQHREEIERSIDLD